MNTMITRGAEWKKWDLHVHAPTTRLENGYEANDAGEPDWDRFCRIIHDSDVSAIGITDYFSLASFYEFKKHYYSKYPADNSKVFFPNLELRLHYAVHDKGQEINIHLILPPDLEEYNADALLRHLKLFNESFNNGVPKKDSCYTALQWDSEQLKGASTTLDAIREALRETFDGADLTNLENYALIVASGRNDGVSPGKHMGPRKEVAIDIVDQSIHAVFARGKDSHHWLRTDRLGRTTESIPKPTFGGCDAHDFDSLEKMLGKTGEDNARSWETTWVKAELSWPGLLQTLAEPDSRVRISELKPDSKDAYRIIESVEFSDDGVFPSRLVFNENLNAVIGSRSSGKSSLLSHIAYSVDPEDTVAQQRDGEVFLGPAAGHHWNDINDGYCKVNWGGTGSGGRVVYIPQNFLNKISNDPQRVTKYILPSVAAVNPSLNAEYEQTLRSVNKHNFKIESLVTTWFDELEDRNTLELQLNEYGSEDAIKSQISSLEEEIGELRSQSNITNEVSDRYRSVMSEITRLEQVCEAAKVEKQWLQNLTNRDPDTSPLELKENALDVSIEFKNGGLKVPDSLLSAVEQFHHEAIQEVNKKFKHLATELLDKADSSFEESQTRKSELENENKNLFARFEANSAITKLEADLKAQKSNSIQRTDLERKLKACDDEMTTIVGKIRSALNERKEIQANFVAKFNDEVEGYGGLDFGIECDFDSELLSQLILKFDRTSKNEYITGRGDNAIMDIEKAQGEISTVLRMLGTGDLKIKRAESSRSVAQSIFGMSQELRFSASLDGDKIGGFSASTMTPGKQSLFALTLILSDAGEDWPLLIDQPEDDLDSRSIYKEIVGFLKKQKQRRQILMVTHNANLVVGADAECVIVANRHGIDRRNRDDRTFDYVSGSLEHSFEQNQEEKYELHCQGIREHVVDILDGGSEAFKKRQAKYKLQS